MNLKQSTRYYRRRLVRRFVLGYTRAATWIPQRFPDFMCIGAPRAATTWVHKRLSADPGIFLPKRKEVHFYDEPPAAVASANSAKSDLRWSESFYFDVESPAHLRWYWHQYRHAGSKLAGDITPLYSTLSVDRIACIRRHMPELKLIYILRNPIERAWSGLRKSVWYQKGESYLQEKDADWIMQQVMRPEVLMRGNYPQAIENWETVFPKEQMLYLFFDDINEDANGSLDQIFDFLGKTRAGVAQAATSSRNVNAAPEKPMPDYVKRALSEHYAEQIRSLESRFGRDLSHWLA